MGGIIRPVEDDVIKTGAEQAEWHADQGQIQQGIEGNVVAGRQAVADENGQNNAADNQHAIPAHGERPDAESDCRHERPPFLFILAYCSALVQ